MTIPSIPAGQAVISCCEGGDLPCFIGTFPNGILGSSVSRCVACFPWTREN